MSMSMVPTPNGGATKDVDRFITAGTDGESGVVTLKKGPWTAPEDAILIEYVRKHGEGNWNVVHKKSSLSRCGKSCRLRWNNHLRPNLSKGSFSPEEERVIEELHAKLGNKWAQIATQLPGRSDNQIKNFWNTRVKRRQQHQASTLNHHHQPHPSPPPPAAAAAPTHLSLSQQQNSNCTYPLPLFNPITSFSSTTSLLGHHNTSFLPTLIHGLEQFPDNSIGLSFPFSSATLQQPPSSLYNQFLSTQFVPVTAPPSAQYNSANFNLNPWSFESSEGSSTMTELPLIQMPNPVVGHDYNMVTQFTRSNSGLSDPLLEETQNMAPGEDLQREHGLLASEEEQCGLDGLISDSLPVTQWDSSSFAHSFTGMKREQEATLDEVELMDDELSSLLNSFTCTMPVPVWYSSSCSGEMSTGKS